VSEPITPAGPPAEITHLVRERTEARARQDWTRADALKKEIEDAGWRVVDRGSRTSVSPAALSTVEVDGELRYGAAAAVPSLLHEAPAAAVTVVVVASESPAALSRLLSGLREHAPAGTQVVVVANDPSADQEQALRPGAPDRLPIGGIEPEVLRTARRLAIGAALNIGFVRATGEVVVLADGSAWPTGDALSPLVEALRDPGVGVAGAFGLNAPQAGPLQPTALERSDGLEVVALEAGWLAFRRADFATLGPLDERFVIPAWLDVSWSLRLRAGSDPEVADETADAGATGEEASDEGESPQVVLPAPRKAVRLDLPLGRDETVWPPDRSRMARRNMYRVLDQFGWRDDLT
jgi:glycosyltransferase involved in cell wall biosynthesis